MAHFNRDRDCILKVLRYFQWYMLLGDFIDHARVDPSPVKFADADKGGTKEPGCDFYLSGYLGRVRRINLAGRRASFFRLNRLLGIHHGHTGDFSAHREDFLYIPGGDAKSIVFLGVAGPILC